MKYYWKLDKRNIDGGGFFYYFYTDFDFNKEEKPIIYVDHEYEYFLYELDYYYINDKKMRSYWELPLDIRTSLNQFVDEKTKTNLKKNDIILETGKTEVIKEKIASEKYVDEKIAVSEHNYHILRGDFNEYKRNNNGELFQYKKSIKEYIDLANSLSEERFTYLKSVNTYYDNKFFELKGKLSIYDKRMKRQFIFNMMVVIIFILYVVLWLRF